MVHAARHRRALGAVARRPLLGRALHVEDAASGRSDESILARISNPVWQAIDISFLFVALIHGLNGFRNILLDYSRVGPRAARAITAALILIGGVWSWWGIQAFRGL